MTSPVEQLKAAYAARHQLIEQTEAHAQRLAAEGKYNESAAIITQLMDTLKTSPLQEALQNASSTTPPKPSAAVLPKGISGGTIAAIAAGVAIVGGGIMLYRDHQKQKEQSWVAREDQRRTPGTQSDLSY